MGRSMFENDEEVSVSVSFHMENMGNQHSREHAAEIEEKKSCETGSPTAAKLFRLMKHQGFKCALSFMPLSPDNCAVDHIQPLQDGGEDVMENIQILDPRVNRMKHTLTQAEFVMLCRRIANGKP